MSPKIDGGFDRMNNSIIDVFRNDTDVQLYGLPTLKMRLKGILKIVFYPLFILLSLLREAVSLTCITAKEKPSIFHATPMYGILIVREVVVLTFAKLFGLKIIVDIRAGSFIRYYNQWFCKWLYHYCLALADLILVEGKKYIPFLQSHGFSALYFPNYTDIRSNILLEKYTSEKKLHFIYIGRVIAEKGVDDSIATLKILSEIHNVDLIFTIVGRYESTYYKNLQKKFGPFINNITFTGFKDKVEISRLLQTSDFFMFLSTWDGEGHSNSVNEAMAAGIPIFYYDHGFTREIVDNDIFLLENSSYSINALKMLKIIKDDNLINKEKSRIFEIIDENFSLTKMKPYLKHIYMNCI